MNLSRAFTYHYMSLEPDETTSNEGEKSRADRKKTNPERESHHPERPQHLDGKIQERNIGQ